MTLDHATLVSALLPADEFAETTYLACNADVAAAVMDGQFPSGHWHYAAFGFAEGRKGGIEPTRGTGLSHLVLLMRGADDAGMLRLLRGLRAAPLLELSLPADSPMSPATGWQAVLAADFARSAPVAALGLPPPGPVAVGTLLTAAVAQKHRRLDGRATAVLLRAVRDWLDRAQALRLLTQLEAGALLLVAARRFACEAAADGARPDPAVIAAAAAVLLDRGLLAATVALVECLPEAERRASPLLCDLMICALLGQGRHAAADEALRRSAPGGPWRELFRAFAMVSAIEATPFTDRGRRCGPMFRAAEASLDASGSLRDGVPSWHLTAGLAAYYQGNFQTAAAAFEAAEALQPGPSHARAMRLQAIRHMGRLQEARRLAVALVRETGAAPLLNDLGHLQSWLGALDPHLATIDGPIDPAADVPGFAWSMALAETRVLHGAVIADRDFLLEIEAVATEPGDAMLLQAQHPHCLEIAIADGGVMARIGDGGDWIWRVELGPAATGRAHNIRIARSDGRLVLRRDGREVFATGVAPSYWLPGDTLAIGGSGRPFAALPFIVRRLGLVTRNPPRRQPWRRLRMASIFWGDAFAAQFNRILVPSLLQRGNLPDLAGECELTARIYTNRHCGNLIRPGIRRLEALGIPVEITEDAFGDDAEAGGPALLHDAVYRAVADTLRDSEMMLLAQPDHVFGLGLADVLRGTARYDYLVAGHPRVDAVAARPYFEALFGNGSGIADNAEMVERCLFGFPHATFRTGLRSRQSWLYAIRREDHCEAHFKEPPPLMFGATREMLAIFRGNPYGVPFEQIDHDIVDYVWRQDRLRFIDDSRRFFWCEFSSPEKNIPTIWNDYWSSAAQFLHRTPLRWYFR